MLPDVDGTDEGTDGQVTDGDGTDGKTLTADVPWWSRRSYDKNKFDGELFFVGV